MQLCLELLKAFECALEIFDDIVCQHIRRGQVVQIGKGLVLDPEDIEAGLVPRKDVGNIEFAPAAIRVIFAPRFGAFVPILRMITGDEVQQIGILHRMLFQRKVNVGAEIIDPDGLRLRFGAGRTLIEENDVRFDTRLIEDARGQTQDCMQITGSKQLLADDLASAALKEHVVRHDYRSLARGFQDGIDVLDEIELLVAAGGPEILTVIYEVFFLLFDFLIGEGEGGFFTEGRIYENVVHPVAVIGEQRVSVRHGYVSVNVADVVQIEIHQAQLEGGGNQLVSVEGLDFEKFLLFNVFNDW